MKMNRIASLLVFAALHLSASLATATTATYTTPLTLSYQGSMFDNSNLPVTGVKSIRFNLYKAPGDIETNNFFSETLSSVNVTNGRFAVILGNTTPLNPGAFNNDAWVGIKVGSDPEMAPRQKLTSVAYALNAHNGVPVGGIIMWSGAIIALPSGWVLCDGNNYTAHDGTTKTAPNLKDKFIIGAGGTYAQTNTGGAASVTLAVANLPSHSHSYALKTTGYSGASLDTSYNEVVKSPGQTSSNSTYYENSGYTGSGTAFSILPPYYALAYIMRVR